jgi:uncharacterized membrane protein
MIQGSFTDIIFGTASDIHPPLFYFILKIWNILFGESVFSMRLLTSICTSSAIFFIYPLSRKLLDERRSLLVLVLYSLSPLNIFFSQEVRMAALNVLLCTASVYYLVRMIETASNKYYKNIYIYLYIFTTVFALYTHYFSFLIIIAQIIFILYYYHLEIKSLVHYLVIYIIIGLCYLAWIPTMLVQVSKGQPWRYPQNIMQVLNDALIYTRDVSLGFYHRYINQYLLMIYTGIVLLILVFALIGYFSTVRTKSVEESQHKSAGFRWLIFLTVFIPLLLAMIISFRQWIEFFKYLSILIPFIIVFAFIGFQSYPKFIKITAFILFTAISIYGDFIYYHYDFKNDDYRGIINIINTNYNDNDKVYVYPYYFAWSIDYYCKEDNLRFKGSNNYGWEYESLIDTLRTSKPLSFWFVLDYHVQDSSTYNDKLNRILSNYKVTYEKTFNIIPDKVILYKFIKE